MESVTLKIRLSVLWLIGEVAGLAHLVLFLFEPGAIEQVTLGVIDGTQVGPELLLLFAIILLVGLVMAFLSLTLKDSTNRWANIIVGIVFTGLGLMFLIEDLFVRPSAHVILLLGSTVVAPALIAWYAWKWPKQEA